MSSVESWSGLWVDRLPRGLLIRSAVRVKSGQPWCSAWQVASDPAEGLL